ncbi:hypothetical protein [Photorhabdus heterorhabditis]|uniref:hypothetical protein n=1 Tax=Photorhabdus heterorhabditis TaxID=880156 RepID=UPI0021D39622|nr:hypothetical protein [Photorhabdus heterorhabditis]
MSGEANQVMTAHKDRGKLLFKLSDKPLKSITHKTNRSEVLDLIYRRNGYEFHLIRCGFAKKTLLHLTD